MIGLIGPTCVCKITARRPPSRGTRAAHVACAPTTRPGGHNLAALTA